jgi:hypothetical protein
MRFLLDENFPKASHLLLAGLQHEIIDFRDKGIVGSPDSEVVAMAITESSTK